MTERDFAYWLQGFFELSADGGVLRERNVDCVKKHINLVRTTQKTSVLLVAIEHLLNSKDHAGVTAVINEYFEHVIDPQHPDQDAANKAHFGLSEKHLIRC